MRRLSIMMPIAIVLAGLALYLGHEPPAALTPVAKKIQSVTSSSRLYTVQQRIEQFAPQVALRLQPAFTAAGLAYPPRQLAYLAFKDTNLLEVYGRDSANAPWRFVKQYPVLAASGKLGPKLAEGDRQVPEGIYNAQFLNANSRFHLSIRLNYPNDFDRRMAQRDGRTRLGGDIMIHGDAVSIGCLAMGDQAAEDLFILVAIGTAQRTKIVVSPTDFRRSQSASIIRQPAWVQDLYANLRGELTQYRRPVMTARTAR